MTAKPTKSKALKAKTVSTTAKPPPFRGCSVKNLFSEQKRLFDSEYINERLLALEKNGRLRNCGIFVCEDQLTAVRDRIAANHERASHMAARSIDGAVFQIMLAYADMQSLLWKTDMEYWRARWRRVQRLLFSATGYLEQHLPVGPDGYHVVTREYMPGGTYAGGCRLEQALQHTIEQVWEIEGASEVDTVE